jgi:hypothetical protein
MVVSIVNKKGSRSHAKIEGISDEFCSLVKTGETLDTLNAVVKGDMDEYRIQEEDVNRIIAKKPPTKEEAPATATSKRKANSTNGPTKKRRGVSKKKK